MSKTSCGSLIFLRCLRRVNTKFLLSPRGIKTISIKKTLIRTKPERAASVWNPNLPTHISVLLKKCRTAQLVYPRQMSDGTASVTWITMKRPNNETMFLNVLPHSLTHSVLKCANFSSVFLQWATERSSVLQQTVYTSTYIVLFAVSIPKVLDACDSEGKIGKWRLFKEPSIPV